MHRTWAIVEREIRRLRRNPTLIVVSMVFPLVQLVILGYAFGGNVKHLRVAVVDQDHGVPAIRLRELVAAVSSGVQTFDTIEYADRGQALTDLRSGRVNAVLIIPPEFSRRTLAGHDPRLALIQDNTDNFVATALVAVVRSVIDALNQPLHQEHRSGRTSLDVVEVYPYVPYIQYLLPGAIVMSMFMMVMIGGGITYIDDKTRGLHEGYLVTPITKLELIAGFVVAGTIKAVIVGIAIMLVGSIVAGVQSPLDPMRALRLTIVIVVTALCLMTLMFLLMVRITDPLLPRAIFGVLNTLLYFPSGAVYPTEGFPAWMQAMASVDPFTYSVHAFKSLLLKNTGFGAIASDIACLMVFSAIAMTGATLLFKRTL